MVSRDSQFSHDRKALRDAHLGSDGSHRENKLDPGDRSQIPLSPPEGVMPLVERSQSWKIAPDLFTSFKYAWAGITYAFTTQRNFRVHTGIGIAAMLLCWALDVSTVEIAVICLTIGAVLVMEILNTALESLVDLTVGQTYHELAKVAKDCAAGAVLMAAIVALLIAALIFIPPLWNNLHHPIV
ncbi:MAG: diacylglycerol kinase family protein [Phormidesmis sp.]